MSEKPKYQSYKPQQSAPLFIRFANNLLGAPEIIQGLIDSTQDEVTKELAAKVLESDSLKNFVKNDLPLFRADFKELLLDIVENGVYHPAINYLNAYMEPSLLENGTQQRWVSIRDDKAPWIEALVCYNLTLFIKAYGQDKIKRCPNCGNFFHLKKFKYKYCSERCKILSEGK